MTGAASPHRIQLRRTKGFRKPEGSVVVTRRSKKWGNPLLVTESVTGADAVAYYRRYLEEHPDLADDARRELRGKDLCCVCPLDQPCHADVLLEVANPQRKVGGPSISSASARPRERSSRDIHIFADFESRTP